MSVTDNQPVTIYYQPLEAIRLPLVNKFYQLVKARGKASGGDIVWVARALQTAAETGTIVAAGRLTPVKSQYWLLCGVYVGVNYRCQGIASQLISHLVNEQHGCYTFAYNHLKELYQQVGFSELSVEQLPAELAMRFKAYQKQGRNIIAMGSN